MQKITLKIPVPEFLCRLLCRTQNSENNNPEKWKISNLARVPGKFREFLRYLPDRLCLQAAAMYCVLFGAIGCFGVFSYQVIRWVGFQDSFWASICMHLLLPGAATGLLLLLATGFQKVLVAIGFLEPPRSVDPRDRHFGNSQKFPDYPRSPESPGIDPGI